MHSFVGVTLAVLSFWGVKGNGTVREETRPVADFHAVDVSSGLAVTLQTGKDPSLVVRADENLLPLIQTEVKNGVLTIKPSKSIRPSDRARVTLTTKHVDSISISGGVEMEANLSKTSALVVKASGGTELELDDVDTETLTAELSGGAKLEATGRVRAAKLQASGGVDIRASDLKIETAAVDFSGGVQARLHVDKAVTGRARGGVSVALKGTPDLKVETSGGTSILANEAL